jgi:ribonucleoside-diphosphate reductase alpha chain
MDNDLTNGHDLVSPTEIDILSENLELLKEKALGQNKWMSDQIGINPSAAITAIKPSGTVSQLVNSASGIHTRHSLYYIRTVRGDKKDPITQLMIEQGIPYEDDVVKPETGVVFSFPMESPKDALCRNDLSAIDQLVLHGVYGEAFTEHKVSQTISVKEDEWLEVGAFVYRNFDSISGVSFLPYSDHVYKQAPYQDCSQKEYKALLKKMPVLDWSKLSEYESDDYTVASQELACSGGACEIN